MKLQEKYKTLFQNYGITTVLREAHFMAQIDIFFVSLRYEKMY